MRCDKVNHHTRVGSMHCEPSLVANLANPVEFSTRGRSVDSLFDAMINCVRTINTLGELMQL